MTTEKGKGSRWSYSAGRPPYTVRVYERKGSPNIYLVTWDAETGREVKRSLKHGDREKAKALADDLAPKLRKGVQPVEAGDRSVGRILRQYQEHRTPDKGEYSRSADERHAKLWTAVLGSGFDLSRLSRWEWDSFLRHRRSGAIDARGKAVPERKRKPVGPRNRREGLSVPPGGVPVGDGMARR